MVIFFTEEDLVSFGEYMISNQRLEIYEKNNQEGLLNQVNNEDIGMWLQINQQKHVREENNGN